jgi:hypothetical protein
LCVGGEGEREREREREREMEVVKRNTNETTLDDRNSAFLHSLINSKYSLTIIKLQKLD